MTIARFRLSLEVRPAREALERHGWYASRAALALGCHPSTLLRLIARHPALLREYASRGHGAGRPRTKP